jgi:hypothetical protein
MSEPDYTREKNRMHYTHQNMCIDLTSVKTADKVGLAVWSREEVLIPYHSPIAVKRARGRISRCKKADAGGNCFIICS